MRTVHNNIMSLEYVNTSANNKHLHPCSFLGSKSRGERQIFFVDDDPKICKEINEMLSNAGFIAYCFTNAYKCLEQLSLRKCDLLITDYKMPAMNGISLMKEAKKLRPWLPVIIITGYGDISTAVLAMKEGAAEFLEKPLGTEFLLGKIRNILHDSSKTNCTIINSLTKMEKEVIKLIADGKNNKEIALLLSRSRRTVENHRAHLMKKLGAHNLVELIRGVYTSELIETKGISQIRQETEA
jgi:FixJ family two-component response regulator